jgi:hypothetical protein
VEFIEFIKSERVPVIRQRAVTGLTVAWLSLLAVIGGVVTPTQASGSGTSTAATNQVQHRSATASIRSEVVRARFQEVKIKSPAGKVTNLADSPNCAGTDWAKIDLFVEWWYGTEDRLTFASSADWGGRTICTGMVFVSNSSSLNARGSKVAVGTYNSCGSPSETVGKCGTVYTSGDWGCGGVGACDGVYIATLGLTIDLPAGWSFPEPAPTDCSVEFGGKTLLCVFDTELVDVPAVN